LRLQRDPRRCLIEAVYHYSEVAPLPLGTRRAYLLVTLPTSNTCCRMHRTVTAKSPSIAVSGQPRTTCSQGSWSCVCGVSANRLYGCERCMLQHASPLSWKLRKTAAGHAVAVTMWLTAGIAHPSSSTYARVAALTSATIVSSTPSPCAASIPRMLVAPAAMARTMCSAD
jgi:hypothetical protein